MAAHNIEINICGFVAVFMAWIIGYIIIPLIFDRALFSNSNFLKIAI